MFISECFLGSYKHLAWVLNIPLLIGFSELEILTSMSCAAFSSDWEHPVCLRGLFPREFIGRVYLLWCVIWFGVYIDACFWNGPAWHSAGLVSLCESQWWISDRKVSKPGVSQLHTFVSPRNTWNICVFMTLNLLVIGDKVFGLFVVMLLSGLTLWVYTLRG